MKKAVIFDLDGTLADTIASITYCGNLALSRFGLPSFGEEDYKHFVGDGAAMLIRRALLAAGDERLEHFEEVYKTYLEIFAKDCMYQVKPYEGICALLEELKRLSVRIAVLSNKPDGTAGGWWMSCSERDILILCRGRGRIFPETGSCRRLPDYGSLRPSAGDFLYVGDSGVDMKTGRAAGIFTVGVLWGFRDREELVENGADAVISKPLELLSHLA